LILANDRGDQSLDAGGFCLLAPDVRHHWLNQGDHTGATFGLLIDADHPGQWPAGTGVEECCQKLTRLVKGVHRFNMNREDELRHSFWLAADHLTSVQSRQTISIVGALLTLLGQCIERLEGQPAEIPPANDLAQQIRRILLSRVGERLSINEISEVLAVSPTRAKEAFRKAFGSGIMAYHNQLKIWQAKRLLSDPSLTVEQISRRLGFSSHPYFSQMFLQHTGESPTEFRRRNSA
jgi:AraC-like DNA-binding protein